MRVKNPDALRRKRVNRRYSQRDLAMLVKRSQTTIYLLETGQMKTLSEDLALHIAARLDVDWEDFFDLEEHEVMPAVTHGSRIKTDSTSNAASAEHRVTTAASARHKTSSAA